MGIRLAATPVDRRPAGAIKRRPKSFFTDFSFSRRGTYLLYALGICLFVYAVIGLTKLSAMSEAKAAPMYGMGGIMESPAAQEWEEQKDEAVESQLKQYSYTIATNDNLYTALQCFGVTQAQILNWCEVAKDVYDLGNLKPGQSFNLYEADDNQYCKLEFNINKTERLIIEKDEDSGKFAARREKFDSPEGPPEIDGSQITTSITDAAPNWVDPQTGYCYYRGTVKGTFYESAVRAGMSPGKTMAMIRVFSAVNFSRDLRDGDNFSVLVGPSESPDKEGLILAAMVEARGKPHYIFRYEQDGQSYYFDESGTSRKKANLICPLRYNRISSPFTEKRFHPVLKKYRPHHGVDYAAPVGTPVKAAADGVITRIGYRGGYGKAIEIKHNKTYTTHYAHLSRYAGGMKAGKKVSQGQVIGYVGSSGLSTGPHLDYRVYKNGVAVNPLKVTSMPGPSVKDRAGFNKVTAGMKTELAKPLPMGPGKPWPAAPDAVAKAN